MGGRYTAVFYAPDGVNATAIGASLFAAVDEVDRQMSSWNPASELCRLNAAPLDCWIDVPAQLAEVLETGVRIGLQSKDSFDIGMGDLVEQWGFGPSSGASSAPSPLPAAGSYRPASATLEIDRARCKVRKRASIAIDLSGIAKGYGVDRLAHCMDGWGIASYLVGIDGEMRARGRKPDGQAWAVAIEAPAYGVREVSGVMELQDAAIATSGDYRRWVEFDGQRHAHTMNPATQKPLSNQLAAVTVLAATCMLADAWATALLVLGERDGLALARQRGMDALFVLRQGEQLQEILVIGGKLCDPG
ncbi:thiamine biosynthesis protein ApbE [Massilia eurypsychrophila]|uniref:FAD:protein FMN transferase n=2 Tax=Massilia eurypsychrophila TaxID=1485217 RepID=A0A2G8T7I7_9BURK|nr:thiamine biosynthesis protein ApbE [Massilia eurypsychrophila]